CGFALNTRLFKRFWLDMDSNFDVLLFYTSIRWVSAAGNVFNTVFQLRKELDLFLQAQAKEEFQNVLTQSNLELAYLVDIFEILNKLNLHLQKKGENLFSHQSIIKAFLDELELWIVRVKDNNLVQFPYVDAMLGEKEAIRTHILDNLWKLQDKFQRYFLEVDRTRDGLSFIGNPFTTDVNSVPGELQEEFLELKNDFAAQDMYQQSTLEKLWASVAESYPNLSAHAVRFLLPFASTYMCETGFSCL
uniref:HAT C-terminal dimerisation domain-containing protein n=1 Tax=Pelodiscus sinensis TaxID=13735 RepID=K7F2N2_PELSI